MLALGPRSYSRMERIANSELIFLLQKEKLAYKLNDFQGIPLRETADKKVLIFKWIYIPETSDTTTINIEVKK